MGKYSDSNPVAGAKAGGGMKNDDGRENGSSYNSDEKPSMSAKHTFDPNEDAPKLGQVSGALED